MANELNLQVALTFFKQAVTLQSISRAIPQLLVSVTGITYIENVLAVTTSALAIPLGGLTTPGWSFFYNQDATNKINLRSGASGADVAALLPGEFAMFRWEGTQTPYAHSTTASCNMEYLIVSA
jgi:hypothetical protein